MRYYIGNTDFDWFTYLAQKRQDDVNFWRPGGGSEFKNLLPGSPFLFRLKGDIKMIGGVGFFVRFSHLPLSMAWDTFREANGCESLFQFQKVINSYRKTFDANPTIGCIALTNPVFFKREDWIPQPKDWAPSGIVQGKGYDTETEIGRLIWKQVEDHLERYLYLEQDNLSQESFIDVEPRYKMGILSKIRLGQAGFRLVVTEAYNRKCAITGEKTLPVLDAAHIKPFAELGPSITANGLLLRSDIHRLFDMGYITVTSGYQVEISRRIKEEFQNGKEYYQFHGKSLHHLPDQVFDRPQEQYLSWHNEHIFKS